MGGRGCIGSSDIIPWDKESEPTAQLQIEPRDGEEGHLRYSLVD